MTTNAPATWHIRTDAGQTFGPATLETLQKWASEGRIAANYHVSSDGRQWIPPADVPELQMQWVIELAPNKFFGPAHHQVVEELRQSPDFASLRLYSLHDPEVAKRLEQLESVNKAYAETTAQLQQLQQLHLDLSAAHQALQQQLTQAQEQVEKLQQELLASQQREVLIEVVEDPEVLTPDTPPRVKPRANHTLNQLEQQLASELKRAHKANFRLFK